MKFISVCLLLISYELHALTLDKAHFCRFAKSADEKNIKALAAEHELSFSGETPSIELLGLLLNLKRDFAVKEIWPLHFTREEGAKQIWRDQQGKIYRKRDQENI